MQVVQPREVLQQVPAHAVEGDLIDEAVVGNEANDAVPPVEPIHRPAEELHVHVGKGVLIRGLRVLGVGLAHPAVDDLVLAVLVVVVLVELPGVVRRVADNDRDRRFRLARRTRATFSSVMNAERALLPLRQLERVDEAQPLESARSFPSARSTRARCSAPRCSTAAASLRWRKVARRYIRGRSFFGMRRNRLTMKLPVPVQGSRICTSGSPRRLAELALKTSATLAHMKSTISCGV